MIKLSLLQLKKILFASMLLTTLGVKAASTILVWPIYQTISADSQGSELWLQNKDSKSVSLQIRIFAWKQQNGRESYADQHSILASPPFVTVSPGERQLIRLLRPQPDQANHESAFRIVIDEIPSVNNAPNNSGPALAMRMRYVLPLFTYGQGLTPLDQSGPVEKVKQNLTWHIETQDNQRYLSISNHGLMHARLSNIFWAKDANSPEQILQEGFAGYVLPGQTMHFPLPRTFNLKPDLTLYSKLADNVSAVALRTKK